MSRISLSILAVCAILYMANSSQAVTIKVPSDQPNIQAGIDAAFDGDTVLVAPGTYTGDGNRDIDFGGKDLVLMSESGPEATIIDCQGTQAEYHRGINFQNGETTDAVLKGFTITNGLVHWSGGGIACSNSSPTIVGNIITGNRTYSTGWGGGSAGGGIACHESDAAILSNKITYNGAGGVQGIGGVGGGISISGGSPLVKENLFQGNNAYGFSFNGGGGGIGGAIVCDYSSPTIIGNTIVNNWGDNPWYNAALVFGESNSTLANNIIAYNDGIAVAGENITITCTNIFGNSAGNWVGDIEALVDMDGNIAVDPLFCDTSQEDFHIYNVSPCAPANNECGELIGALGVECSGAIQVNFDIKPGSCPNPLNGISRDKSKAVLPVAILGTDIFNVREINPESVSLNGVSPLCWNCEDVSTPVDKSEDGCTCSEDGPDGYEDLTLKFDRQAIIASLNISGQDQVNSIPIEKGTPQVSNIIDDHINNSGPPIHNDYILKVEGLLNDGDMIEGFDCVLLMTKSEELSSDLSEFQKACELGVNNPNPFNPMTRIGFYLPIRQHVKLEIYNIIGQKVATLINKTLEAGKHSVEWNGYSSASGMYFYRMQAGKYVETKKMILLK